MILKKYAKKIILLTITFIFLYLVIVNIDVRLFFNSLKHFNYKYIIIMLFSMVISLSFRALCFKQLISKTIPDAKMSLLIPLCLTGAAFNIVMPARAGDIFRAYYTGLKYNADKVKIFGTVMLERIFDVFIIFCFLTAGILFYHKNELALKLCLFAGIIIVIGICFSVVTYKFNYVEPVCRQIELKTEKFPFAGFIKTCTGFTLKICNSFFNGFEIINSPKIILSALFSSFFIWAFDCLNYYIIILGFGYDLHWSVTIFIISFIALACMIPSASIFIGPYQLAVISAFAIYNVPKETALAISLTEQAVITISMSLVAIIFMLKNNISYKELKADINKERENCCK